MPRIESISKRLTHKYKGPWKHLDQWEGPIGQIKVLGGAKVRTPYEQEAFHLSHQPDYGPGSYLSRRRNKWVYPWMRPNLRKCDQRKKLADFYHDNEGNTVIHTVVALGFKGMSISEICRAIEEEFTSTGCGCAHDCCGCQSVVARVAYTGKKSKFTLTLRYSYNF
jgi:hypothetical protein